MFRGEAFCRVGIGTDGGLDERFGVASFELFANGFLDCMGGELTGGRDEAFVGGADAGGVSA